MRAPCCTSPAAVTLHSWTWCLNQQLWLKQVEKLFELISASLFSEQGRAVKGQYQAVLCVFHWGICFSLRVTSECFDEARERDCAQVYPVSEIKQSSRDLLGVCEISHSDAGRQARTLTQVVQMKLWNSFEDKSCWGCSCPGPWGGMLQPLFSHNFPLSTGSSCSVIYQQTLYCFSIYLFTEEETKNPDVDTIVIPLSL